MAVAVGIASAIEFSAGYGDDGCVGTGVCEGVTAIAGIGVGCGAAVGAGSGPGVGTGVTATGTKAGTAMLVSAVGDGVDSATAAMAGSMTTTGAGREFRAATNVTSVSSTGVSITVAASPEHDTITIAESPAPNAINCRIQIIRDL